MFTTNLRISLLSLALPLAAWADPHAARSYVNRHHDLAKRAPGNVEVFKRFSSARWSFYDVEVGAGACGQWNKDSDFTVALNTAQFGGGYPGPHCFEKITMTYNGKTTTATIMDECPGCPYGGLDLTKGLFSFFADQSVGIIYGEWEFSDGSGGGGGAAPTTTTEAKPTSTWTPPSTTWTPPVTTSSTKEEPSSTSTWSSSSSSTWSSASSSSHSKSSSASSSIAHSSSSSVSAAPSGAPLVGSSSNSNTNNLDDLNHLFVNLAGVITSGAGAKA